MPLIGSTSYICAIQFHLLSIFNLFYFLANAPERHLQSFLVSLLPISLITCSLSAAGLHQIKLNVFIFVKNDIPVFCFLNIVLLK